MSLATLHLLLVVNIPILVLFWTACKLSLILTGFFCLVKPLFFPVFLLFGWWKYILVLEILQDLTLPNIFCSHFLHIFSDIWQFSSHINFILHPKSFLHSPDILSEVTAHLVRNGALCYEMFLPMFETASFSVFRQSFS